MKNVYIIEDDTCLRQLLERFFARQRELAVHIAADPGLCPLYHTSNGPLVDPPPCDVLIVDNRLPVMTGVEFIRRHGGAIRHKAVMSANFSPEDLDEAKKLGCKVFKKPFRLQELSDWIMQTDQLEYPLAG